MEDLQSLLTAWSCSAYLMSTAKSAQMVLAESWNRVCENLLWWRQMLPTNCHWFTWFCPRVGPYEHACNFLTIVQCSRVNVVKLFWRKSRFPQNLETEIWPVQNLLGPPTYLHAFPFQFKTSNFLESFIFQIPILWICMIKMCLAVDGFYLVVGLAI